MKFTNPNFEFIRFIIIGCVNTLSSYMVYLIGLMFFSYIISYTIAYVIGILISYYLNSTFVFRSKISMSKLVQFPLVYLVQYFFGVAILYVCVNAFYLNKAIAAIIVVIFSLPITFLLSRYILKRGVL